MNAQNDRADSRVTYPMCGRWDCDDDEDWETITPATEGPAFFAAVKREHRIAYYHQPRAEWPQRLRDEREKRNGGEPLWKTR